jgi:hypothetical protein
MMSKVDFKKELKHLYQPASGEFVAVDVPPMNYLMVDGHGDPNTARAYQDAIEALYAVAYKLKFMSKKELGRDYVVPPLEGLWWAADMDAFTIARDKSAWDWTMMIMQPEWITQAMFESAVAQVKEQKGLPALSHGEPRGLPLRLETYHEGLCLQILHIGSYEDEAPVLERLHQEFMPQNGYIPAGKHHEIYLSDPRRAAPDRLKTVLRQPVRRLG